MRRDAWSTGATGCCQGSVARRSVAGNAGVMQVRMLILAGVAGVCGWVARGVVALPEATAEPKRAQVVVAAPPVIQVVMAPSAEPARPAEEAEDEVEEQDEEVPESAGEDIGAVIARAQQQVADHNSIYGIVTDQRTGEALPGVTVVVSGRQLEGSQTAITDEHGFYKITNLPAGYVLATFYYADWTVERDNVVVSSLDPTPVYQRIDQSVPPPRPVIDDYIVTIPSTVTFEGIVIDEEYTKHIPVPGRTFEAALGEAVGDDVGVSFSSRCGIENTYVIE